MFAGHEVGLLHGQLAPDEKRAVMDRFRAGEVRVLVATTVIEVGVDVPERDGDDRRARRAVRPLAAPPAPRPRRARRRRRATACSSPTSSAPGTTPASGCARSSGPRTGSRSPARTCASAAPASSSGRASPASPSSTSPTSTATRRSSRRRARTPSRWWRPIPTSSGPSTGPPRRRSAPAGPSGSRSRRSAEGSRGAAGRARRARRAGRYDRRVSAELAAFLRENGIRDERVLAAMAEVPRARFVPDRLREDADADRPLPIGHGQTISQPFVVAYMTEQLRLAGAERVLEVGTGSGYQTAILAQARRARSSRSRSCRSWRCARASCSSASSASRTSGCGPATARSAGRRRRRSTGSS